MFLLVPAHPGFPGQNPESCKTIVYVCVCFLFITLGHVYLGKHKASVWCLSVCLSRLSNPYT